MPNPASAARCTCGWTCGITGRMTRNYCSPLHQPKKFPVHGVDRTFPAAEAVQKDNQSLQEANGQRRHEKILHECAKALASGP